MLYTNTLLHGGDFNSIFLDNIKKTKNIRIASGYFSLDILQQYKPYILDKIHSIDCKILLGMAFYEGLSQKQLDLVQNINTKIIEVNPSNGFYVTNGRKYHGKIYEFDQETYLGSSNFSLSGFKGNIEATIKCSNEQKNEIDLFLNKLFSPEFSINVSNALVPIKEKRKLMGRTLRNNWENLKKHNITFSKPNVLTTHPIAVYDLLEQAKHEKSNMNIFFGKGRLNTKTGIITPRPWYEFEIIAGKDITSSKGYPQGSFNAYTDDGYIIPMKTSGDYKKNLRSEGGLQVFGRWFKGRLESDGSLEKFKPVSPETLIEFGKTKLSLYQMKNSNDYFMRFEN